MSEAKKEIPTEIPKEKKLVRVRLIEDLLGTAAKDKEIYKSFIESKKPLESGEENEAENIETIEEKGWTGFLSDDNGLFVYDYYIKGFFKNAGHVLREVLGIKGLRPKITNFLFIEPRKVYLGLKEPSGYFERPLRISSAQGERVALARSDKVPAGTEFSFTVSLLKHKELTMDVVDFLLKYGENMGFGQFRNGGWGRFIVVP